MREATSFADCRRQWLHGKRARARSRLENGASRAATRLTHTRTNELRREDRQDRIAAGHGSGTGPL